MEIIGVGTDIIEIPRIKSAMEKEGFAEKVFTEAERGYIFGKTDFAQTAAAMFCAAKAAAKALGTGFHGLSPGISKFCTILPARRMCAFQSCPGLRLWFLFLTAVSTPQQTRAAIKLSSIGDG